MKFICLGYLDENRWETLTEEQRSELMDECIAYDDELRRSNHFLGGEALGPARDAVTLTVRNGSVDVMDGPFSETKEVLGGILLLEANDLNHAIALMSRHPGVKAGAFEIRAADEHLNQLIRSRSDSRSTTQS